MKHITKLKLAAVAQLCKAKDKSAEFMIQFMQDTCKVDHDTVIAYMSLDNKEYDKLFAEVNDYHEMMVSIDSSIF